MKCWSPSAPQRAGISISSVLNEKTASLVLGFYRCILLVGQLVLNMCDTGAGNSHEVESALPSLLPMERLGQDQRVVVDHLYSPLYYTKRRLHRLGLPWTLEDAGPSPYRIYSVQSGSSAHISISAR